jgi:hypothetical protein
VIFGQRLFGPAASLQDLVTLPSAEGIAPAHAVMQQLLSPDLPIALQAMIHRAFVRGRPFVAGRVVIESITPQGSPFTAAAEIPFLGDTGADFMALSPDDYETRLGLAISAAPVGASAQGPGGEGTIHPIADWLLLPDDTRSVIPIRLTFSIPAGVSGQVLLQYSILGRDVWGLGNLSVRKPEAVVTLGLP